MSITVRERELSRDWSVETESQSKTVHLIATGSREEEAVKLACELLTPLYAFGIGGVPLRRAKLTGSHKGSGFWLVDVEYQYTRQAETATQDAEDNDPLGIEWTFDGTGGVAHITQSITTRYARARGDDVSGLNPVPVPAPDPPPESGMGTAPDNRRAIGLTYDRVEGCDVPAPKMELTATLNYLGLTFGQVRRWGRLTGKTNKYRWKGFEVGELLYHGPAGNAQPGQLAKATHKFSFAEILEAGNPALVVDPSLAPGGIVLPRKRPHDYLWVGYRPFLEQPAGGVPAILQRPTAAYVEQVAREGDFTDLGLGS